MHARVGKEGFDSPINRHIHLTNASNKEMTTDLQHIAYRCTERVIDQTVLEVTSYFDERCDGGVVGGERQNSFHEITKRRIWWWVRRKQIGHLMSRVHT